MPFSYIVRWWVGGVAFLATLVPSGILFAAPNFSWPNQIVTQIGDLLKLTVPLLVGVALIVFLVGVIRFMRETSDEKRSEERMQIVWGIVGLFVIVSVWGLVFLLSTLTGIGGSAAPVKPPQSLFP